MRSLITLTWKGMKVPHLQVHDGALEKLDSRIDTLFAINNHLTMGSYRQRFLSGLPASK